MAQWNSPAPGEDLEDLSDGFEGMEDIGLRLPLEKSQKSAHGWKQ